jgi:Coenzyme PQQ synthesis protein D (PqqD)
MESNRVFRRSDSLVTRDLAGEKVIIPVRGKVGDLGSIYTLNSVGSDVWKLVDGRRNVAEIVSAIGEEYEVDFETLSTDVRALLTDMFQEGLIELIAGGQE